MPEHSTSPVGSPQQRWPVWAWVGALLTGGLVLGLLWRMVWCGPANADEGFYLAAGRATLEGAVPAVDYGYTQTPLFPTILAVLVGLGGDRVLVFRLFCAALTASAVLMLAVLAGRRSGPLAALALGLAFVSGVPGVYFLTLGKTYACAQLLLVAAAAVMAGRLPVRWRWAFLVALGTAALGCRLTVAPAVAVLWGGFAWKHRRELGWWRVGGIPAVCLALMFVPLFLGDARRAWFWVWEYHLLNTRDRHPAGYWSALARLAPAMAVLAAALPLVVLWRRPKVRWFGGICFAAGVAGLATNIVFAGVHGEYVTPFIGLVLFGGIELAQDALGTRFWLVPALGIAVGAVSGWRQVPAGGRELHAQQAAAAAFVARTVPPGGRVLAARPEIPVAAGRALMPDMVMGVFSVTTDLDEAAAERLGLVAYRKMVRWVEDGVPTAVVLGVRPEECFAGSVPSMRDVDPAQQQRFWTALAGRYGIGFENDYYLVLVRKPGTATSVPQSRP